ncbi:MAG: nitroreductase family protein [Eubacteriales bacterium]|nr:nitroreductase family protein [Eubacteriales bacterium]
MNDTLKTISERFSCRNFTDQVPEKKYLEAIAQAAIQAPSGMNRQCWHVIVVNNRDLISEMDKEGINILSLMEDRSMYERIMKRGGNLFYNAPCMILIALKEAYPKGAELIDCGILAQNISLAATSLGIANLHCGFVGLAFAGNRANEFKEKLKFPDEYECGMGVLLGYTENAMPPHVPNQNKITYIE